MIDPTVGALERSWETPPPPPGRHLGVEGPSRAVYGLAHRFLGACAAHHRPVLIVDCALRFDPYAISEPAKWRGEDPRQTLERLSIVRPFTAFQLHRVLEQLTGRPATRHVVVLGLMDLWRSEEMRPHDASDCMAMATDRLGTLRRRGVSCLFFDQPVEARLRAIGRAFTSVLTSRYEAALAEGIC